MAGFFLTLTTSVFFSADAPNIEVLVNGVVSASFIETELEGSGSTTRTLYIDYVGLSPSDITVQINDASGETGRYLVLEAVAVNGQNIRNNTLNVNDGTPVDLLTTLESMDFDTTNTDWLFGQTEPLLSYFGTSTYTGTGADDTQNGSHTVNDVMNMGGGNDIANGRNGNDFMFGGAGNDLLVGADGHDVLVGGDGNDELRGQLGNDILYGGLGDDVLYGNEGNDTLNGGAGNDLINGFHDDDVIYGEAGMDKLYGGDGNDTIFGGDDKDFIYGEAGMDNLSGGEGDDIIEGGDDNDIIAGDGGNDRIWGDAGDDNINGGAGLDTIYGGLGIDTISGGDDNDRIEGNDGDDILNGDAGQDYIYGGLGNDIIDGGTEADILYGEEGDDIINGGDQNDTLYGGDGIDTMDGGAGSDRIYGDAGNDIILGNGGSDTIFGGDGNDNIDGGAGSDRIYGEADDDTIYGRGGDDIIEGGDGNDTIYGNGQNDILRGDAGDDYLKGGTGDDNLYGGDGNDDLRGDDGNDRLKGGAGNDQLRGGDGDDVLAGEDGDDILYGQGGNDKLYGQAGNDDLRGGDGDDHLFGREGIDILQGNNGNDTLVYDGVDTLDGGADIDTILVAGYDTVTIDFASGLISNMEAVNMANTNGIAAANNLQISMAQIAASSDTGNMTITGDVGLDQVNFTLTGSETRGADVNIDGIDYAQFNDGGTTAYIQLGLIYNGSVLTASGGGSSNTPTPGDDVLTGTSGEDTISALAGNDIIIGEAGNDTLSGDEGNDNIYGGEGNDTLNGGDGNDILHASLSGSITPSTDPATVVANNPGVVYSSETGNFYQFVTASANYTTAAATAAAATLEGISGHLVTITTVAENTFIENLTGTNFAWMDGTDSVTEGTFVWTAGPDAGTQFWNDIGNYTNFYQGSPTTNSNANDNVIFLGTTYSGTWYAYTGTYATNYLIEWEGSDVIQEIIVGFDSRNETNYLNGGAGDDQLYGSMGRDILVGGTGADILEGGAGNDKLYADGLSDAEIQAILTANPGVTYSEETGNFYQFVSGSFNYANALAGASSTTINGIAGHLATITSAEENSFINGIVGANFVWIDGSDAATEGTFVWTTGPDAGTQFWNDIGNYENWYQNSPTSNTNANDHVVFLGQNYNGQWYIFGDNTNLNGYVIEWETSSFGTDTSANSLNGGYGADDLYASGGIDTFIFEAASAFSDIDTIHDFDNTADILDISDILSGINVDASNVADYVSVDELTGVRVDVNGTGTFGAGTQIASFSSAVGVDDALTMFNNGDLIV